ncbi:hypothetical protein [Belnapia sp. F-4-1]|nr:hypothetical protein [Belnapia sp. F-4-1]
MLDKWNAALVVLQVAGREGRVRLAAASMISNAARTTGKATN